MSRDIGVCSETLTYSGELSSTGSCRHASRSWTCRQTSGLYKLSVVLEGVACWVAVSRYTAGIAVRAFRVKVPSAERYWSVVDHDFRIVREADEYLRPGDSGRMPLRGCLKTVRFGRVAWSWS